MKNKKDFKKIALLGLTSGMIVTAHSSVEAGNTNETLNNSILEKALAANCRGPNGCSGLSQKCNGPHGCSSLSRKCNGPNGCSSLSRKCNGPNGCSGLTAIKDEPKKPSSSTDLSDEEKANSGNVGYHLMTEQELMMELDSTGTANYNKLDAKGKEIARYVASQRCNGTNMCAGLNACQTDKNKCAGKGSCKGQGKCAFADKNLAVKVVLEKMTSKRNGAQQDW